MPEVVNTWNGEQNTPVWVHGDGGWVSNTDDVVTVHEDQTIFGQKTFAKPIVGSITGTAAYADADALGNDISTTYQPRLATAVGSTEARLISDRLADVVNVKDYGAKGDGTTDDTSAIQAAMTAGKGKVIVFPAGTYIITDTLTLPGPEADGTTCIGYGATIALENYMPDDLTIDEGISGLRFVGASGITIKGIKFHKVWHGIDVFLSMDASDYPATETNNIHDIRIEGCEFDTSQWAICAVGVFGLTVCNCTMNQDRLNAPPPPAGDAYSNRDGVHTLGCCNVVIDNIIGATDDDFVAVGCGETFINPNARTTYGVCQNYVITNCVMNNNRNGVSESGSYSFVGVWGEELTSPLSDKYRFSVDNIKIADCIIETDVGCAIRNTGASAAIQAQNNRKIGRVTVSNCVINRPYVSDTTVTSDMVWAITFVEGVDELIVENCRFTVDPRWTDSTFSVGILMLRNELRSLVMRGCDVITASKAFSVTDGAATGVTPDTRPKIDTIEITDCSFTTVAAWASGKGQSVMQLMRREAARCVFRNVRIAGYFIRFLQMLGTASIDDLYLDALGENSVFGSPAVLISAATCVISRTHASKLTGATAVIDNKSDSTLAFSVIGDFSSPTRVPFKNSTNHIKTSGMSLAGNTWCKASDVGSLALITSGSVKQLCVMDNNQTWQALS